MTVLRLKRHETLHALCTDAYDSTKFLSRDATQSAVLLRQVVCPSIGL